MSTKKKKSSRKKNSKIEEEKKEEQASEDNKKGRMTIQEKYKLLEQEIQSIMDQKLRLAAEFENFRRRTNEEKVDWIKNATQRLVLELCDVLDNFERALHPDNENGDVVSFRQGVEMIFKQLTEVLKKEGVIKLEAMGKEFDPNYHEALAHIPSEEKENTIVAIIQNGYTMNDKIIRPARVAVSNGKKPQVEEEKPKKKTGKSETKEKNKEKDK